MTKLTMEDAAKRTRGTAEGLVGESGNGGWEVKKEGVPNIDGARVSGPRTVTVPEARNHETPQQCADRLLKRDPLVEIALSFAAMRVACHSVGSPRHFFWSQVRDVLAHKARMQLGAKNIQNGVRGNGKQPK